MNELSNQAKISGSYKNNELTITTNLSTINFNEDLLINIIPNKTNWINGTLKYTITVTNNLNIPFTDLNITDYIDESKVNLINNSIEINSPLRTFNNYTFANSLLTIYFPSIAPLSIMTITFEVRKRSDDFFLLHNYCTLNSLSKSIISNNTTVISRIRKSRLKDNACNAKKWRI